ncbi:serine hydrolase domain-containing protein [Nocardioides speluncae]|uniref:serine hydrolase domain-containing protein n=1 Tax=Nocardioides speluncae TaxID=2670337 RepID=UPI000D689A5E|nr:serine hydrolase domain-containing protein [Nocardioides speluncae]
MTELLDTTTRALRRIAIGQQVKGRLPGVAAGVARHGKLIWNDGIGSADLTEPDRAPGPDDQFLIASNTKTFTAVMIMQLRDEGRLTLDDTLDQHLPEVTHPGITIRQMLSHSSGMQREPVGDIWDKLVMPDRAELFAGLVEAERVHLPHHLWHYSNLMYNLLGEVIARLDGTEWSAALQRRLLDPLELRRTSVGFDDGPRSQCYYVPPYSDVPVTEPVFDLKASAPCGALASTLTDLATWSGFVADPDPEILSPDTLEEMCQPQIVMDVERWQGAMGLGFFLIRSGHRVYAGHTGGMPGQISGLFTDRESGTGGAVLMNSTSAPDPAAFAIELAEHVIDHDPEEQEVWRPGTTVPEEYAELLGTWYTEGSPHVFSVRDGRLEARSPKLPDHKPSSVFEKVGEDLYRTVAGRERGELLRVTRDESGAVLKLNWATYLVTREPLPFGVQP